MWCRFNWFAFGTQSVYKLLYQMCFMYVFEILEFVKEERCYPNILIPYQILLILYVVVVSTKIRFSKLSVIKKTIWDHQCHNKNQMVWPCYASRKICRTILILILLLMTLLLKKLVNIKKIVFLVVILFGSRSYLWGLSLQ